jgi:hypothetical protein
MNAKLLAIASALAATAALASAAEAGGGVRLGFRGPLGTFVATPSHGPAYGGGGSGYRKSMKRKAPVAHAARKPEKVAPRVAKAEPTPAPAKAAPKEAETTTEQTVAPVTGSSALIQGSIPAETPPGEAEKPAPEVKAEAPSEPAKTAATEGPEACKRFVPAVGVTVSVDCEQ